MRLIDADKIRQKLNPDDWGTPDERWRPEREFGELIDNAPTVDLWHYPSQGELPPRGEQVLCWLWNGNYVLAFIREDDEWTTNGKNAFDGVKCWQYIVPPKEQKMTEKLKKCPFCGGKATLTEYKFATYKCKVECTTFGCGISTMLYEGKNADKEAIDAWNRRAK